MATNKGDAGDQDVQAQITALRQDLEKLTEALVETGRAHVDELAKDARERGTKVVEDTLATVERGREFGEQRVEGVERWIQRNPMLAVLCAVGAGYVVAQFQGRR
ncbi:MAG: hypothetical protein EA356_10055 [Geminicoccaceae bacterium]|nr:MAG: hypothetical protein EA356_10055 [Geminicoccaceae bacterium]